MSGSASTVHVVDYGVGNLYSVARAIERSGGLAKLTSDPVEIAEAERLLLPGVGAFQDGMLGLKRAGVETAIHDFARSGRPMLGICLGMQMLATESTEHGHHDGLGIIPGRVEAIPTNGLDGNRHKVPFVGWAKLEATQQQKFVGTVLDGLDAEDAVYLVHSFQFKPDCANHRLAVYLYDGMPVTACVRQGNIIGCQFHPEKSAGVGLGIIRRFLTR